MSARFRLRAAPEPFTPASLQMDSPPPFVDGDTRRRLSDQIDRYVQGQIGGRMTLISGPRGVGKTTLTLRAVESVTRRGGNRRPLLVRLSGPAMSGDADVGAGRLTVILEQVMVALYRALCAEVAACYRRMVLSGRGHLADRAELAAQLQVELEGVPSLSRLRDFWRRARAIEHGVLFEQGPDGQGAAEVAALWHASRAWLVVNGTLEQTAQKGREDAATRTTRAELVAGESAFRELLNPLLGLLTGGIVGVGVLQQVSLSAAATLGVLIAVASTVVLNLSTERRNHRTAQQAETFTLDTGARSLSRAIPRLIHTLRDIGLAPVFVVDDLDEQAVGIVQDLHTLTATQAFVCIIAASADAFPAMTAMARLRVRHPPWAIRAYLLERLQPLDDPDGLVDALAFVLAHRALGQVRRLQRALDERQRPFSITDEETAQHSWRLSLLVQLAIEWMMAGPQAVRRWAQTADGALLAALYTISTRWQCDHTSELVLSDARLRDHLGKSDAFLIQQVRRLAAFLANPSDLLEQIMQDPRGDPVRGRMAAALGGVSPLLMFRGRVGDAPRYAWAFDPFGEPLLDGHEKADIPSVASG
ncbi:MAG: hypothetical protein AAFV53_14225 [Myxococcota bacterium]